MIPFSGSGFVIRKSSVPSGEPVSAYPLVAYNGRMLGGPGDVIVPSELIVNCWISDGWPEQGGPKDEPMKR
jgi:hypothetical protein